MDQLFRLECRKEKRADQVEELSDVSGVCASTTLRQALPPLKWHCLEIIWPDIVFPIEAHAREVSHACKCNVQRLRRAPFPMRGTAKEVLVAFHQFPF